MRASEKNFLLEVSCQETSGIKNKITGMLLLKYFSYVKFLLSFSSNLPLATKDKIWSLTLQPRAKDAAQRHKPSLQAQGPEFEAQGRVKQQHYSPWNSPWGGSRDRHSTWFESPQVGSRVSCELLPRTGSKYSMLLKGRMPSACHCVASIPPHPREAWCSPFGTRMCEANSLTDKGWFP